MANQLEINGVCGGNSLVSLFLIYLGALLETLMGSILSWSIKAVFLDIILKNLCFLIILLLATSFLRLITLVSCIALTLILSPIFPKFALITHLFSLLPGLRLLLGLSFLDLRTIGWNTLSVIVLSN